MDPELFLHLLSNPELVDQLAEMSAYPARQGQLQSQQQLAAEMFGSPGAEGRNVGRAYVASSPLEHLGVAVRRGIGANQLNTARAAQTDLANKDVEARKSFSRAMAEAMRRRHGGLADPYADMAGAQYANEMGAGD